MYRVKRAVILAAGTGSRMNPVTLETPKPLIKINGTRIIDTIILGLHKNGITEIYVVAGYMKEKFKILNKNETLRKIAEGEEAKWYLKLKTSLDYKNLLDEYFPDNENLAFIVCNMVKTLNLLISLV